MMSTRIPNYLINWAPDAAHFKAQPPTAYDLGCGSNYLSSIYLKSKGYSVAAVDLELTLYDAPLEIKLLKEDARNLTFDKCDLIIAADLFQFLRKSEAYHLLDRMISSLNQLGQIIFTSFTNQDPSYLKIRKFEEIEKGTFISPNGSKLMSYFALGELRNYLDAKMDLEILDYFEGTETDSHPPEGEHTHGVVKFVVQKSYPDSCPVHVPF